QDAQVTLVRNARYEPEQVLVLATSADVGEKDIQQSVSAWILPIYNPTTAAAQRVRPYVWDRPEIIDATILKEATPLSLQAVPAEREYTSRQAFRYDAEPGRYVHVRVTKGLRSYGRYVLENTWARTALVPPFAQEGNI